MRQFIGILFISILISACSKPQAPDFKKVNNVRVTGQTGMIYTIAADAIYENPNGIGGQLTGMEMDVYVDDVRVTHISQTKDAVIHPETEFTVPIVCEVDSEKLLKENQGFLKGALNKLLKNSLEIRYEGHLKTKFLDVEFKVPVSYSEDVSLGLNIE